MEAGDVDRVIKDPKHPIYQAPSSTDPLAQSRAALGQRADQGARRGGNARWLSVHAALPGSDGGLQDAAAAVIRSTKSNAAACYLYDKQPQVAMDKLSALRPSEFLPS